VKKAFKGFKGLSEFICDTKAKKVVLTGNSLDVVAAVAALNKAGFHGSLKKAAK
jgi:hypothetical protein